MDINLPNKEYNFQKLVDELLSLNIPSYQSLNSREELYFVKLLDTVTQADIDNIIALANVHDPSLTKEQQARELRKSLSVNTGILFELVVTAEQFETPYRQLVLDNTIDIDLLYAAWRPIYDALENADKVAIQRITQAFTVRAFSYDEPVNVTEAYKLEFNNNIFRFLNAVYARAGL